MSDEKKTQREIQRKLVRNKIEQQVQQVEDERKRELLKRRLELARNGATHYAAGQYSEAAKLFMTYIRVLEDWKGASRGGLSPANFDLKTELSELVLLSGIYWDLVKLFDRTQSANKQDDFKHYLDKYVLFSKGFTFQPLASEAIRKYMRNGKPVHKAEFKAAYVTLSGEKCFIATSLMDVCDERTLPRLRTFRDEHLSKSLGGRALIVVYYKVGPKLVGPVNSIPWVREKIARVLDRIAERVSGS
ncbi:MAG: hypothetical protein H7222_16805 [Methylotenera sp.]|nr:hypothetical protein [Oligoflexia bacterium]